MEEPASRQPTKTISYSRVVHLSHVIDEEIPRWPGDPPVELSTVARRETDGFFLRRFALGEHGATHANAPLGFQRGGLGIEGYEASALVVPAVVIDVAAQAAADADHLLTAQRIRAWEEAHGRVAEGSVVLLHTGWQDRWSDSVAFLNADSHGVLHFPGFGLDAVELLLEGRGVAGVGIDTHGVDGGRNRSFAVNRRVLAAPRLVLENLANLDLLPSVGATVFVGILRLRGGSGSPASVLALIP